MLYHPPMQPKPQFYFNAIRETLTETLFYLNGALVHRQPR